MKWDFYYYVNYFCNHSQFFFFLKCNSLDINSFRHEIKLAIVLFVINEFTSTIWIFAVCWEKNCFYLHNFHIFQNLHTKGKGFPKLFDSDFDSTYIIMHKAVASQVNYNKSGITKNYSKKLHSNLINHRLNGKLISNYLRNLSNQENSSLTHLITNHVTNVCWRFLYRNIKPTET